MKKNFLLILSAVMMMGLLSGCNGGSGSSNDGTSNNVSTATTAQDASFDATGDWHITITGQSGAAEGLDLPGTTTLSIEQGPGNLFIAHLLNYDIEGTISGNTYTFSFTYTTDAGESIPLTMELSLDSTTTGSGIMEGLSHGSTLTCEITAGKITASDETIYAD